MDATLAILTALAAPQFKIVTIDKLPWLIQGKDRFRLPRETGNWEWSYDQGSLNGWPVGNGITIKRVIRRPGDWELFDLAEFKGKQEIARLHFDTLGSEWLKKDDLWGGHQKANNLRYLAQRTWLSEFSPAPGKNPKWGLAILTAQNMSESAQPILDQALVRIDFSPFGATFLGDIGYFRDPNIFTTPNFNRICLMANETNATVKNGLFEYTPNQPFPSYKFDELDKDEYPVGSISDGEVLAVNYKTKTARLWSTYKTFEAHFDISSPKLNLYNIKVSTDSSLFRVETRVFSRNFPTGFELKTIPLLWKNWTIEWDGKTATIYDGFTGKRITTKTWVK